MRALPSIALAANTLMLLATGCLPDEVDLNPIGYGCECSKPAAE